MLSTSPVFSMGLKKIDKTSPNAASKMYTKERIKIVFIIKCKISLYGDCIALQAKEEESPTP